MKFRSLHHVGFAARDAAKAAALFTREFGLTPECAESLPDRKLKVVWARAGDVWMEFLEPQAGEETVTKFLAERGEGIHHICFDVEDAAAATKDLASRGLRTVYPAPRPGALGRSVNFVHPKSAFGVLVEFAQEV